MTRMRTRSSLVSPGFYLIVALGSLTLRAALPPIPLYGTMHDDLLQVQLADRILSGQWLGDWGVLVMLKGPGYPLFLAAADVIGVPPTIVQQVIYLGGALLIATALSRLAGSPWAGRAAFLVLALNPAMLGFPASRVYRDAFVAALALLVLGCLLHILAFRSGEPRRDAVRVLLLSVPAGLALGMAQITRADTQWLLLSAVLLLLLLLVPPGIAPLPGSPAIDDKPTTADRRSGLSRRLGAPALAGAGLVVIAVLAQIPSTIVSSINGDRYGLAVVDLFSEGGVSEAWRAWVRVEPHSPDPLLPLSPDRRAAVYAVSPAARELEAALTASPQAGFGSGYASLALAEAGADVANGSARAYDALYRTVAAEIEQACNDDRLSCSGTAVAATLPVVEQWHLSAAARTLARDAGRMWPGMETAFPIGGCGERFARDGCFRAGILPGPIVDNGTEYPLWSRTVAGLLPSGDLPDPRSWPLRTQIALTSVFSALWWVLLIPATVGLVGALVVRRCRLLGLTGLATTAGALASAAAISVYSVHTGTSVTFHYYLGSSAFALTATIIGVICLAVLVGPHLRTAVAGRHAAR